jgi:hypothetical protein
VRSRNAARCRGDQPVDALPAQRLDAIGLDHAQARRVHLEQAALAVEQLHALRLVVHDRAQAPLALAQRAEGARLHRG